MNNLPIHLPTPQSYVTVLYSRSDCRVHPFGLTLDLFVTRVKDQTGPLTLDLFLTRVVLGSHTT